MLCQCLEKYLVEGPAEKGIHPAAAASGPLRKDGHNLHTILLIDDEPMLRRMIKEYMRNEGYRFLEASDGNEALGLLEREPVSLVLLDVMMPNLDGWSTLRQIRRLGDVPVILLTARGEEQDRVFGFELGADDYIVKPFSPRELLLRIKALLKRTGSRQEQEVFEFGGLRLELESHNVTADGAPIRLKPKEFDLLVFFVKNPGKVHSRENILSAVWGYDYYGDNRTVDTHIKSLREQLGKYRELIVTVWGSGYKFEPKK